MKLHFVIIASAGLLLGACSSSYKNVFPEPAYVKISSNNGASYMPYPPQGQDELVGWYETISSPLSLAADKPARSVAAKDRKPAILSSDSFSAKLYRDRTEISHKDKDGHWLTSVRPSTPADQRMRDYILSSKKAR